MKHFLCLAIFDFITTFFFQALQWCRFPLTLKWPLKVFVDIQVLIKKPLQRG